MSRLSLSLLLSALSATCQAQTLSPQSHVWSICELFENLASHGGKIVAVRGLLYQSKEISALGGNCGSKFVTKYQTLPTLPGTPEVTSEYVWPTAINLASSNSRSANEQTPITFSTDSDSIQRTFAYIAERRAEELARSKSDPNVLVTVTGMLHMKSHYDIGQLPDGKMRGGGYGHLSIYPAELVILRMSDPVVAARKPEK